MVLALSRACRMHASRAASAAYHISSYSAVGPFSTFTARMRYTNHLKVMTDPTIADFYYENFLHAWIADVPSFNYWFVSIMAFGAAVGITSRHVFFNPDTHWRYQERRKPLPDRHRQWSYSLPFFNHRIRNISGKYRWCMIDNEPDWIDNHPLGYRPNRVQSHRRPYMWVFTVPRYAIEDPLFTSVSHANMNRIYEEIGYTKKPKVEGED